MTDTLIRPPKSQRDHWRRRADGTWREKVPYSREEAAERALSIQALRGTNHHAYRCPVCASWHVGRTGPPRKRKSYDRIAIEMYDELGERVCAHLRAENSGDRKWESRLWAAVRKHWKRRNA